MMLSHNRPIQGDVDDADTLPLILLDDRPRYLGTHPGGGTCDCCQRGLRRAYVVEIDGEQLRCGIICASRLLDVRAADLRAVARL